LWLVLRIKGDRVDQFRRAAGRALLDLGMALRDFAGLHESVGDVGDKLAATDREALGGDDIGAADHIDL
jgi:hypothetical protein